MYRWIVARTTRWAFLSLIEGRSELPARLLADNVRFRFPGTSSFAAELTAKTEMLAWVRRFRGLHPDFEVLDVLVAGWPWDTRIGLRIRDRIGDDYANEGMEYLRMRWGRLVLDEVFVDTERIAAWEARHPELRLSAPN